MMQFGELALKHCDNGNFFANPVNRSTPTGIVSRLDATTILTSRRLRVAQANFSIACARFLLSTESYAIETIEE